MAPVAIGGSRLHAGDGRREEARGARARRRCTCGRQARWSPALATPVTGRRARRPAPVEAGRGCAEPPMDARDGRREEARGARSRRRCARGRQARLSPAVAPPVTGRRAGRRAPVEADMDRRCLDTCASYPVAAPSPSLMPLFFAGGVEAEGSRCSGDQRRVAAALCLQCTPEMAGGRRLEVSGTASLRSRWAGAGLRGARATVTCSPPAVSTRHRHLSASTSPVHQGSARPGLDFAPIRRMGPWP